MAGASWASSNLPCQGLGFLTLNLLTLDPVVTLNLNPINQVRLSKGHCLPQCQLEPVMHLAGSLR